jgi:hypothetical protein
MIDREQAEQQRTKILHFCRYGFPLGRAGRQAAMLVVAGVLSLEDAASMSGLMPTDLIREAEAWAVAAMLNDS